MPIRFRPPRDVPDLGLTPGQQARFNAWLRTAFTEIAEDMATLGQSDAPTIVAQETIDVAAGSLRRVTPPTGGMTVRVPAPTPGNAGQTVRLMLEAPVGELTVVATPGIGDDGKVFQPTINGAARATFSTSGLVTLTSNGSSDWKSASEFAAESPASVAISNGGGALDATYLLRSANARLPNARVADDSTEIDISYSSPGLVSWFLKTASVAFSKLANLAGLSVLGRAANTSGVMAAITATEAKQVLRNRGDVLHWEYPVSVGSPFEWIFDGVDDRVEAGDVLDMTRTTARSIFFWYATDVNGLIAVSKQASATGVGWRFAVSDSNLDWILRGSSQQLQAGLTTPAPLDGSMHMLGMTYDGSSNASGVEFYLDTVSQAKTISTNNLTSQDTTNAVDFRIGARSDLAFSFNGGLQHISIWNRVLTAAEVAQLSNGGEPADLSALSFFADCILWYKLDETDATGAGGIVDHSASNFDGTAAGGLAPSGGDEQVHTFVEGGGVALDVLENVATVTREAISGAVSAAAGSNATQFAGIRDNGSLETARGFVNLVSSTSVTLTGAQDAGNDEIEITAQRAALTGFAAASANSNATTSAEPIITYSASANMSAERVLTTSTSNTIDISVAGQAQVHSVAKTGAISQAANANTTLFAGIRDNGSAETDRTNLNFVSTTFITAAVTDDAGNDELEIGYSWTGVAVERNNVSVGSGVTAWDYGVTAPLTLSVTIVSNEVRVTYGLDLTATIAWTGGHSWNTAGDFDVTAATVGLVSNSTLLLDSVGDMTLQSDGDLILTGDEVRVRSNGTGGFLTFDAATASTPGLAANEGMFWVFDQGVNPTLPMFTDDANNDRHFEMSADKQVSNTSTGALGTIALADETNVWRWGTGLTSPANVDGFSGNLWNGRRLLIRNGSGSSLAILTLNQNAAGSDGIHNPNETAITLVRRQQVWITYDATSTRWYTEGR